MHNCSHAAAPHQKAPLTSSEARLCVQKGHERLYHAYIKKQHNKLYSIPVCFRLERAFCRHTNVVSLLFGECCHLSTQGWQMQSGHLLIQCLGEQVNVVLVAFALLPVFQEVQLAQNLVGEGARHHEGWVACGATQVTQATRCKHDDAVAIWEDEAVHLGLDVIDLDACQAFKCIHLDLIVKVTNVAHDGVVLHLLHGLQADDLEVACGGNENVDFSDNGIGLGHLEDLHACLQGADGVDLSDHDTSACTAHGSSTALANITVPTDQSALAANHHISGTHDRIGQGVTAAVHVVELGLGHAVIHVDGWEKELPLGSHLFQAVDSSSGLLTHTLALLCHSGVFGLVCWDGILQ